MTDRSLRGMIFAIIAMVFAVVILMGIGFMWWRSHVNDSRCEKALGAGASWSAGDDCWPPPVHVDGLMGWLGDD